MLTEAHRKKSEQYSLLPCTSVHRCVPQSCPPCPPCARVVFTEENMAHTSLPFLGDAALHVLPVFLLGLSHTYMTSQGLSVAHTAIHWGIHSFLNRKLPSLPCLAPELPLKVESCSHSRHVGHAGKGSAQSSSSPPKNIGNPCLPRDKGKQFPWAPRQVQAAPSAFVSLSWGKLLLFTSLICATALFAAGGQNCLTHSSLRPVSITSVSTAPQHKTQHCAVRTLLPCKSPMDPP